MVVPDHAPIGATVGTITVATSAKERHEIMRTHECTCGYQAASDDDLTAHLGEWLIPGNDTAEDGRVHAEAARAEQPAPGVLPQPSACLCGFEAATLADLDAHLLAVFTPPGPAHRPREGTSDH